MSQRRIDGDHSGAKAMTTNQTIDGVSRGGDALVVLIDTFRDALHRGKQPTFSAGDLKFFITEFSELRALLDAPVVRRQEPKGAILRFREYVGKGQGGRDLWHDWTEWSTGTVEYAKSKLDQVKDLTNVQFEVEWLYAEQPAPVALSTETRTPFEIEHDAEPGDEAAFRKWRAERNHQTCCGSCPGGCVIAAKP